MHSPNFKAKTNPTLSFLRIHLKVPNFSKGEITQTNRSKKKRKRKQTETANLVRQRHLLEATGESSVSLLFLLLSSSLSFTSSVVPSEEEERKNWEKETEEVQAFSLALFSCLNYCETGSLEQLIINVLLTPVSLFIEAVNFILNYRSKHSIP